MYGQVLGDRWMARWWVFGSCGWVVTRWMVRWMDFQVVSDEWVVV